LIVQPVGPAGDLLHLPLRITGGTVTRFGADNEVVCGTDFALMYADGRLAHDGRFAAGNGEDAVLFRYGGFSAAGIDAYDALLDGQVPARAPSELVVCTASTCAEWRLHNRRPLVGIGTIDLSAGELVFILRTLGP
jgi:hypothetical protein